MERTAKIMAVVGLLFLCGSAWAVDGNEPVAHWKFDETSGTIAHDSAGDNDGNVYGAVWTAGQIDGALSFDGDGDYVDCGNTFASVVGSGTKTIMAWVNSDTVDYSGQASDQGRIITLYRESGSSGFVISAKGNPATWQGLYRKAGNVSQWLDSGVYVVADEWTHVALVQDGANVDIYINGVSENSTSDGAAPTTRRHVNADIGAYDAESSMKCFFEGSIDEVRIYDRALAAKEIRQLYLEGLSDYERAIIQIEDAVAEKEEMFEGIDETLDKEVDAYYALEELLESKDYGDLKKGDIITAKQKLHLAIRREEQSIGALDKSIERLYDALAALGWEPEPEPPEPNEPELDPNLISHWKFDETSGTIAYDSVGDNDGTFIGDPCWTSGRIDGALEFDGVDDYISCGTGPAITGMGPFSVVAWFKTGVPKGHAIVVQRSTTSANGSYGLGIVNGKANFYVYNDGLGFYFLSNVTVNDGLWHHIVAVRTSSTDGEIYVDGTLDGTGSGPARSLNNVPVWIGGPGFTGPFRFNGLIDDVRIYDRALSAEEAQQLYQDGL